MGYYASLESFNALCSVERCIILKNDFISTEHFIDEMKKVSTMSTYICALTIELMVKWVRKFIYYVFQAVITMCFIKTAPDKRSSTISLANTHLCHQWRSPKSSHPYSCSPTVTSLSSFCFSICTSHFIQSSCLWVLSQTAIVSAHLFFVFSAYCFEFSILTHFNGLPVCFLSETFFYLYLHQHCLPCSVYIFFFFKQPHLTADPSAFVLQMQI